MLKSGMVHFLIIISIVFSITAQTSKVIQNNPDKADYVIDSDITFEDAVSGKNIHKSILENLRLVNVYYFGFDNKLHKGQLVVHKDVVLDIIEIFEFIRESHFPISKVIPISKYDWSDEKSMQDNNTSAFNYRYISGTRVISNHASGLAIDINPLLNPYIKNEISIPSDCIYNTAKPGTISSDSELVKEFKKWGWQLGGNWKSIKDYQHFEIKLK